MQSNINIKNLYESYNQHKQVRYLCWILAIAIVFGFILILNVLTPMIADDYWYSFTLGKDTNTRVSSFSDILGSQIAHYYWWGGRSIVHCIVQVLLLLPPFVADVLNSSVFIAYIALIYYLIKGRGKHSLGMFLLIFFSVWFLQPSIGDTILWMTGSGNYLWGTVLILLFIIPYRFYEGKPQDTKRSYVHSVLFFIYGIIAGWTNENTGGAMIVLSILFIYLFKIHRWDIPKWSVTGVIGAIIGYLFMLLAPGNMVRAGESMPFDIQVFVFRFIMHSSDLVYFCGIIIIIYILLFFLSDYKSINPLKMPLLQQISLIFIIAMFASVYAMVLSPAFPPRAWFGSITFLIIGVGTIFYSLQDILPNFSCIRNICTILAGIAFLFSTYDALKDMNICHTTMKDREVFIREAKLNNESEIKVKRFRSYTKFTHSEDRTATRALSTYYDIKIEFEN